MNPYEAQQEWKHMLSEADVENGMYIYGISDPYNGPQRRKPGRWVSLWNENRTWGFAIRAAGAAQHAVSETRPKLQL